MKYQHWSAAKVERFERYWINQKEYLRESYPREYKDFERLEKQISPIFDKEYKYYEYDWKRSAEISQAVKEYFDGNILRNSDVFAVYLLLNQKGKEKRLSSILDDAFKDAEYGWGESHYERALQMCIGLTEKYHHTLISASFTHDLEKVTVL